MKKTNLLPLLAAVLLFSVTVLSACGKSSPTEETGADSTGAETAPQAAPLPDSLLYYGEIVEIKEGEDGLPLMLVMDSQADGEYSFSLGAETVWVDCGNFASFSPEKLQAGDRLYVFHSPVMTMSLPPQSPALAVVKNIPMDARCPMYHEIEAVEKTEDGLSIISDNGSMIINADSETAVSDYEGRPMSLEDIKEGGRMMVIYEELMNSAPSDPWAHSIMLLP